MIRSDRKRARWAAHLTPETLARVSQKVRLPRWTKEATVKLRTRYSLEVRLIQRDIHPTNQDAHVIVLALDSDTGEHRGLIGIPGADWPEVRDTIDAVFKKTLGE